MVVKTGAGVMQEEAAQQWLHWRVDTTTPTELVLELQLPPCGGEPTRVCQTRDAPAVDVQLSSRTLTVCLAACSHHTACHVRPPPTHHSLSSLPVRNPNRLEGLTRRAVSSARSPTSFISLSLNPSARRSQATVKLPAPVDSAEARCKLSRRKATMRVCWPVPPAAAAAAVATTIGRAPWQPGSSDGGGGGDDGRAAADGGGDGRAVDADRCTEGASSAGREQPEPSRDWQQHLRTQAEAAWLHAGGGALNDEDSGGTTEEGEHWREVFVREAMHNVQRHVQQALGGGTADTADVHGTVRKKDLPEPSDRKGCDLPPFEGRGLSTKLHSLSLFR